MAGYGNSGTDARQITQQPSSSGGSGGIFGNASAAIGDIGIGSSSAELGDTNLNMQRDFSFAAPVVNNANNNQLLIVGGISAAALIVAKMFKVV